MAKKKKGLISDKIIRIAEILTAIGVIGGIGYSVGRWQSLIEHKTEIMEIRQQYNTEISNLKIDYNNSILELQNEIKLIEISKK